jgi:protein translocase SecG subunit
MRTLALVIQFVLSILLITSILFQTTKSEGLSGTIGGKTSAALRGARTSTDVFLEKATTVVAVAWFLGAILTALMYYH